MILDNYISFDIKGLNISPILDIEFKINDQMAIAASIGYQLGLPVGSGLSTDKDVDINPKTNSNAFFEPDATQFIGKELNPKGDDNGLKASVCFLYRIQ